MRCTAKMLASWKAFLWASVSSLIAMVDFHKKKSFVRSAPPQMKGTLCVSYVSFDIVQLGNFLVVQSISIWLALVGLLDVVGLFGGWSEQPELKLSFSICKQINHVLVWDKSLSTSLSILSPPPPPPHLNLTHKFEIQTIFYRSHHYSSPTT
jgi:hypothetical protein